MKNKAFRPLAVLLSTALLIGSAGAGAAYAITADKPVKEEHSAPASVAMEEKEADFIKDETVYVLAEADGSIQKIIVSDWIKNAAGQMTFSDESSLTAVENVKGDESYTLNGENLRVWDTQGNDIYYRGNIEKELPVSLSVSYKLDGKAISASELAGKSGKVSIRFNYRNNQYETVEIDGREEKIYVPFAMLTGMLLDTDVFTNVKITNGKLLNDGNHMALIGIAFPGLQSNLNIDVEKLEIPDYVEITADVKNFEMMNTVTIAANGIFNKLDTEKIDSDNLASSLTGLTEAMDQLMNGSSALYDGLCTLLDKSGELIQGIDKLAEGAQKLKEGAGALDSGAAELAVGAKELAGGLNTLSANNDTLNSGAKQVFDSLLATADTQLSSAGLSVPGLSIGNYAEVLNAVIASLDPDNVAKQAAAIARQTVTDKVNEEKATVRAAVTERIREEVRGSVTEAVRSNTESQILAAMGMTKEEYEAGIQAGIITKAQQEEVNAAIRAQMETETVRAMIEANVNAQMQTDDMQALVLTKTEEQIGILIEQNMTSPEVQAQITAALEKASSGAASISALKEQLDSYNQFYLGLNQYTSGVAFAGKGANQLADGAVQLKDGTAELYAGMNELTIGILTLKDGAPALKEGVTQLRDGAMQLSEGLKQFNEEGVQKLVHAVDGDIASLYTRVRATVEVSKNYKSFSGLSDNMDGQVKFIYRTEAIEAK